MPQGGRTALALGRPLAAYDVALDLGGLRRTVEYVPDDLTVTVEAGRRLGALQAELAEHRQYLPIDPPPGDDVTIGGLLELAGTERTVDRSTADLRTVTPLTETPSDSWRVLRAAHGDATSTVLRAGVPPTAVRAVLEVVERSEATAWAHYAAGAVVVAYNDPASVPTAAEITTMHTEAERLGGFLLIESASAALRHEVPASPGDAVLVEALRDRFDPSRTVNRGRWGAIL